MCGRRSLDRRGMMAGGGAMIAALCASNGTTAATTAFIEEAFRQRDLAVAAGDQPFGAVVVLDGRIVGLGPSRVVMDGNADAHAERVALWAALKDLGRARIDGAVIYSSSIPCLACQRALAAAGVTRMIHGRQAIDAGPPRGA